MQQDRIPLIVSLAFWAGLFTGGLGTLVGVVIAYMKRDELNGTWAESVLTYYITTFWVGLLLSIVGTVLALVLIGYLILAVLAVWYLLRCIRASLAVYDHRPIEQPTSLFL